MYERMTYDILLKQMLETAIAEADKRGEKLDTREGSILWYGQAPSAVELQNMYISLDEFLDETFADTASREPLIRRCAERGIIPYPATHAIVKGQFTPTTLNLPIGTRFNLNSLNYFITEKISDGTYKLQCETVGEIGNDYFGTLIPIEYVAGLETTALTELLIPGEDDEATELLRERYLSSFDAQAFGGNVADYKAKIIAIDGVGGVKVHRDWHGTISPAMLVPPPGFSAWLSSSTGIPEAIKAWLQNVFTATSNGWVSIGGTVRLVLIDSTFAKPSAALIDTAQTLIDPIPNHGEGVGLAPIGHYVTVTSVENTIVNISTQIVYSDGHSWDDVRLRAEEAIDAYFKELATLWADSADALVVRASQIETRFLKLEGVMDISETAINGFKGNLTLSDDNIPVRGLLNG